MRLRIAKFAMLASMLCFSIAGFAQTATVTGTVTDPTKAVVPGANVTLNNEEKGIHLTTVTNSAGSYLFSGLNADTYAVEVTAPGFKQFRAKRIVVRVAEKVRVDASLQVGDVSATVYVQGSEAGQVQTESSEEAGTITERQISQLELNGRNFTQLVTLVPGVSNQTGQDEGAVGPAGSVSYAINGGRTEYNNWQLDGGENMDTGSNANLNVYPNVDAISEVRVLTNSYGAQYGRSGSGTIVAETKSGTNEFHGEAFEYLRNEIFNARSYFSDPTQPKPGYKKNDFGYTLGGPIQKDKTYFFWSQEFRRENIPWDYNQHVPSNAERSGDFSERCPAAGSSFLRDDYPDCPAFTPDLDNPGQYFTFPNNSVAGYIDHANSDPLMALVPAANSSGDYYRASLPQRMKWHEELIKIDHNFNDSYRGYFRFIHDSWQQDTPSSPWSDASLPTIPGRETGPGVNAVFGMTMTLSPTFINRVVGTYTSNHLKMTNLGQSWVRPSSMTMTGIFDNGFRGTVPEFTVGTNGPAYDGGFTVDAGPEPFENSNPTYSIRDDANKVFGKHTLSFGIQAILGQKNEDAAGGGATIRPQGILGFYPGWDASYFDENGDRTTSTGSGLADLMVGNINSFTQTNTTTKYHFTYKIVEPYLQDDWRVTPRLTLNLGLRLSLFGLYHEKDHQEWNFVPSAFSNAAAPGLSPDDGSLIFQPGNGVNNLTGMVQCGTQGVPDGCMTGHLWNPAPRIGFAFDPTGSGKTAIRGAYGIFYEHMNGNEANSESTEGNPPLILVSSQPSVAGYTSLGGGQYFPMFPISVPGKAQWPYMQQWHLDIQRELFPNTLMTVAYVGSKGTHLPMQYDMNQVRPTPASANPFPQGQPLTWDICESGTLPNGTPITGQAALNLSVACSQDGGLTANLNRPYRGYNTINRMDTVGNSNYNALQVSSRSRTHGLELTLAYTYSHSIDNSSDRWDSTFVNSYDLASNRASSNFDQRHNLTISYVYDVPIFAHAAGIKKTMLGGWQLSGITTVQSGTPFSVYIGGMYRDAAGVANGSGTGAYLDVVGDPHAVPSDKYAAHIFGPLMLNPAAFAEPTGLTFGNAGRNSFRYPGRTNFDMALFKHFALEGSKSLEFRAEGYNVFNHTQFTGINNWTSCFGSDHTAGSSECVSGDSASGFLHPSGAHNPRIVQFALKFLF